MAQRIGRRKQGRGLKGGNINQRPWRQIVNSYKPIEIISADRVEAITNTAFDILENIGMDIIHEEAKQILKTAGADVDPDSDRVRFDRDLIQAALATAPSSYTLHSRNPEHNLDFKPGVINVAAVASSPNVSDIVNGRRPGNYEDYKNLLKLSQSLNIVHLIGGYPVEPIDVPPRTRHLNCVADMAIMTDKVFHAYSLGRERITDALEITRIAHGAISWEEFGKKTRLLSIINTSSPLRLDGIMIDGAFEMARHGQLTVITPFTLSGAMAPVTIAGALAQQHAEAIAAITLMQLFAPGCPVAYGGFTSNVDMKSGAPAFGTPENAQAALIGGQLARHINIPYRSTNANASNSPDAQASYESQMSIWSAMMGHANILKHGCGWLEGGLCTSFEKFIIDAEMLQMMSAFMTPPEINTDTLALDAIKDVGPGGHFFGTKHTLDRYEDAFYAPMLSDWNNFESWAENGSKTATERAHDIYKQVINEYTPPAMDIALKDEIQAFVDKRIIEGGVTGVF